MAPLSIRQGDRCQNRWSPLGCVSFQAHYTSAADERFDRDIQPLRDSEW